ncbi:transglutaminase-like domain-containing protein [Algoriphagus pacificus]|uniref:DUF3857 domain-containing protein n=1 Tax=Algoriphagus pacificus TaxID=2811234 RepID=A0ABS3CBL7_9BACT|nr:transglutaminase-like domain-containing protein [Algoriphagus pacificus]MBN7814504.1 DUF3857 domain-containing protein [Algoriphagus pacificus]
MVNSLIVVLLFFGIISHHDTIDKKLEIPHYSILKEKTIYSLNEDYGYSIIIEKQIKVLSKEGLDHAFTSLPYDKFVEIKDFYLQVIDPKTGKTLEKARMRDMSDVAIVSNTSIFEDNRRKYYRVKTEQFPVEVIIRSESYHKTNYFFPEWIPVNYLYQKVEESKLELIYPESGGIRYKELNLLGKKEKEELSDGFTKISWTERDLPILGSGFEIKNVHRVLIAPREFSMEGHLGIMNDWAGFAAWQFDINKGRGELPESYKKQILQLVDGVDDLYKKVSILYSHLQQNYRYVSIQLGIGGWQTMTAEDVIKYSYGDCKGLTNLMKSMLEVVGIPSYYTLVLAGEGKSEMQVDFPSNQFNHVILQVPTEASPIWLECTSNLLPAGYLGEFTKGRDVLVTQDGGGYITQTPAYNSNEWNKITSKNRIEIDHQGNATLYSLREMKGNLVEEILYLQTYKDIREQKDFFNENLPIKGLIVEDYLLNVENRDSIPVSRLELKGHISRFAQSTAKRLLLKPFFEKITEHMVDNLRLDMEEIYEISLPSGVVPELENMDFHITEPDFDIQISHKLNEGKLEVNRSIKFFMKEELNEDAKQDFLKRINETTQKSYFFNKSNSLTN